MAIAVGRNTQSCLQRVIENGVARAVGEVGEHDGVFMR